MYYRRPWCIYLRIVVDSPEAKRMGKVWGEGKKRRTELTFVQAWCYLL